MPPVDPVAIESEEEEEEEAGYDADDNAEVREVIGPKGDERRTSAELYALRVRGRPGRPHNVRSPSWADADHHSTHPAPIMEVDIPAQPSSSPSSSSESESEQEPLKATLSIPTPVLSSSPSSYTSETSDSVATGRQRPVLAPVITTKRQSSPAPASSGLWRRLTARKDGPGGKTPRRGSFGGGSGSGSEKDSPTGVGLMRRKTMAMLGRSVSGPGAPPNSAPAVDGGGTGESVAHARLRLRALADGRDRLRSEAG
ncbi:hypothetical protein EVJ58_g68 [Rhodofomes roseus]|uniref:Uncharacterized protein n=1 Tax=Rhodofomes roseus TaxID=34475 RepID=A0A4Y9Z8E9_9APHY|nr:hypothetical protein EVJ58_g68 [Rhodofomes roseus]